MKAIELIESFANGSRDIEHGGLVTLDAETMSEDLARCFGDGFHWPMMPSKSGRYYYEWLAYDDNLFGIDKWDGWGAKTTDDGDEQIFLVYIEL